MKRIAITLAILMSSSAFAANVAPNPLAAQVHEAPAVVSPWTFEIGAVRYHESYSERDSGGAMFAKETVMMTGLRLGATRAISDNAKVSADLAYATGNVDYTGAYWGGSYGSLKLSGFGHSMLESNVQYKVTGDSWHNVYAIAGLGYRRLADHLEDAGPGGYYRENNRIYATLGIERPTQVSSDVTVTPRLLVKPTLYSHQYSDLYGGVTNKQNGWGAELAVDVEYRIRNKASFVVTPFVKTWDMPDSNVVNGMYEPKNKTTEVGINFTGRF